MSRSKFLSYLKNEKRLSGHTVLAYQKDLDQFCDFCREKFELNAVEQAKQVMIRSWVVHLVEQKYSPTSVRRKISAIKTYYRFLQIIQVVKVNPVEGIVTPKLPSRLPVFVEEKAMKVLFNGDSFSEDFSGKRDELLVTLLYETGIRRAELINLKVENVNFHKKEIKVLGKRNKERVIPVSDMMISRVQNFLKCRQELGVINDNLLVTDKGKKMYPKFVYRKIKTYLSPITTSVKKSPHVLRHSFATHLLNNGAELNSVKELLGHASLAATQVYTHNTIEKLKEIHKINHPKS